MNNLIKAVYKMSVHNLRSLRVTLDAMIREREIASSGCFPAPNDEERMTLRKHGRIKAIKLYRERVRCSIVEGKAMIDEIYYKEDVNGSGI